MSAAELPHLKIFFFFFFIFFSVQWMEAEDNSATGLLIIESLCLIYQLSPIKYGGVGFFYFLFFIFLRN